MSKRAAGPIVRLQSINVRNSLISVFCLAASLTCALQAADTVPYPTDYREWVFVSSGLGMTYGAVTSETQDENPKFDNVFVTRAAYRAFLNTGRWPDKTMFVLDVRSSESKSSINHAGHFQSGPASIQAEMKQGGQWTFYKFDKTGAPGQAWPKTATCYACHSANGASDNTFVQFYPTLLPIAKEKGTLKQ